MEERKILELLDIPEQLVQRVISDENLDLSRGYFFFTGKGLRSSQIHLGHYVLYSLLARLSSNKTVYFQVSNDQKRNPSGTTFTSLVQVKKYTKEFFEVLSKFDWNLENLVVFDNLGEDKALLDNAAQYLSCFVNPRSLKSVFGEKKPYFYYYFLIQCAPLLILKKFEGTPVVVSAQDQTGFFQILRDVCVKLGLRKPLLVVIKPLKNLYMKAKMSSSEPRESVPLKKPVLSCIRKAVSGTSAQDDFCVHFLEQLELVSNQNALCARLRSLWKQKKSFEVKKELSQHLERFCSKEVRNLTHVGLHKYLSKIKGRSLTLEELESTYF